MNITCDTCRERWDELFDDSPRGESQPEVQEASGAAELREHMAQCAQCRSEFALLQAAREELHVFPAMAAPVDLRARIRQQLEAEAAHVPAMTQEEISRHKVQIDHAILDGSRHNLKQSSPQSLKTLWLRFQKSLRHPATMALSSGAALLLICFVSLSTFQTEQAPMTPRIVVVEPEAEDALNQGERKEQPAPPAPTRNATSQRPPSGGAAKAAPSQKRMAAPAHGRTNAGSEPEVDLPSPRNNAPAIWKVTPPRPSAKQPAASEKPSASVTAPLPAPANPIVKNGSSNAASKVLAPRATPPQNTMASQSAPPEAAAPAPMIARESQDTMADAAQADGARAGKGPGGPPAAMAQRAPQLGAGAQKSASGSSNFYLARRRRGAPERIEASITAPRHISNAEVVVELPEEAQFTDGSRSRVLWRGSVKKDESIAVKFDAEVEPEAEDARVVLKETKDGETETVAYKDVPVGEAGRRRSR